MKEDKIQRLIEKYKDGNSTLNEEQFLFEHIEDSELALKAWSTFVKNNTKKTPRNFNDTLWESFKNKKNAKHKRFTGVISVAASVLLLIAFIITNPKQKKQSYFEKEKLLSEALTMFDNTKQNRIQRTIFYENDMVIIYLATEKK